MKLIALHQTQMSAVHAEKEELIAKASSERVKNLQSDSETVSSWLQDNIRLRKDMQQERQAKEIAAALEQAQDEEDELFMHITMHLRDKPNREQRGKKLREIFEVEQEAKQRSLKAKHDQELHKLMHGIDFEIEALRKSADGRIQANTERHQSALRKLGRRIGRDRRWFRLITARRIAMIKEHQKLMRVQLEAGQEAIGLTENEAMEIQPLIPNVSDEEVVGSRIVSPVDELVEPVMLEDQAVPQSAQAHEPVVEGTILISTEANEPVPTSSATCPQHVPGSFPNLESVLAQTSTYNVDSQCRTPKTFDTTNAIARSSVIAMSFLVNSSGHDSIGQSTAAQTLSSTSPRQSISSTSIMSKSISQDGKSTGKRSLFRGFRRSKDLTDDEIKYRMASTVGDGFGS